MRRDLERRLSRLERNRCADTFDIFDIPPEQRADAGRVIEEALAAEREGICMDEIWSKFLDRPFAAAPQELRYIRQKVSEFSKSKALKIQAQNNKSRESSS